MWSMKYHMIVEQNPETSSGTFYNPVLSGLSQLDEKTARDMAEIHESLAGVEIKDSKEEVLQDAPADPAPQEEEQF